MIGDTTKRNRLDRLHALVQAFRNETTLLSRIPGLQTLEEDFVAWVFD